MAVVPTSELDAVNDLLVTLGRKPLAALSAAAAASLDETIARQLLGKHNRVGQTAKDWKFNYAEDVVYTADGAGNVILGTTATSVIARVTLNEKNPPKPFGTRDVIERLNGTNWQLYDLTNKTFDFGAAAQVRLDLTYWRDFAETPEAFRRYVTAKAKEEFVLVRNGSREMIPLVRIEMEDAWAELLKDHLYRAGLQSFARRRAMRTVLDTFDAARPILHRGPYLGPIG